MADDDIITPLKASFRGMAVSPMLSRTPPSTRRNISYNPATPSSLHDRSSVAESSDAMLGSKSNPHMIFVNPEYPEKHMQFDIQHVESFKQGDFVRSGFHIRAQTSVQDKHIWDATMFNGYETRSAILIKAPSRSSWFDNVTSYHRRGECAQTKDAHSSTASKIKTDSDRGVQYHLLVFGEGMILDNGVLSDDPKCIVKKSIGLTETVGTTEFRTMMVYWVIAKRDGGYRANEETEETVDDLFG
jgi:hypothetical protein